MPYPIFFGRYQVDGACQTFQISFEHASFFISNKQSYVHAFLTTESFLLDKISLTNQFSSKFKLLILKLDWSPSGRDMDECTVGKTNVHCPAGIKQQRRRTIRLYYCHS